MRIWFAPILMIAACAHTETETSPGPRTVSVEVSSNSDGEAERLCGGRVRPETIHHESNVITYRCLEGAN